MKTIFLASGRSSRLDPISDKNLLEFCGEPLLLRLLKNAEKGGLKNFIVVTNPENTEVVAQILKNAKFAAQITQQKNLDDGMAGGVLAGLDLVENSEEVFVLGGNDLVDLKAYQDISKIAAHKEWHGALLAKKVEKYFPGGYLQIDGKNKIQSIVEKPGAGKEPSNLVNLVVHFFRSAGSIKKELGAVDLKSGDAYEQALHALFQKENFAAVEYDGPWNAIKYPWHVLETMDAILLGQKSFTAKDAQIADTARIRGEGVVISEGAKIFDHATIVGPCFIGKNAVVGTGCLVRNSIVGEKCVVGFNTEVARSFLARNVSTHIAYVGDTVADEGVNFGAFCCTTNLRLDQKTVRVLIKEEKIDSGHVKLGAFVGRGAQIGCGAKLMPGVKIKSGTLVMPGEVVK